MHAFIQRFACGKHVFFRAGPLAKTRGDPWVWGCLGELSGSIVTLVGYNDDDGVQPKVTPEVLKAAIQASLAEGLTLKFDRLGRNNRTLTSTREGKLFMIKHHGLHPHPDEAKNADGSIDHARASAGMDAAKQSYVTGKIKLLSMNETTTDDGFVVFTSVGKLATHP